jgi:hypothetical protein
MNAILLLTGSGALVALTSYPSATDPALPDRLHKKRIGKFLAYKILLDLARQHHATHFVMVGQGLNGADDLLVLDFDGQRTFKLSRFAEMGSAIVHEGNAPAWGRRREASRSRTGMTLNGLWPELLFPGSHAH